MSNKKIIDIVIPVFNEEKYLSKCLDSVLKFKIPDNIDIVIYIIDGNSTDQTKNIIISYTKIYNNIIYLFNERKIQSCALNLGIKMGNGDFLMRLDAHSFYPDDYLIKCFNLSTQTSAENVGGIVITLPGGINFEAKLVQAMTTHKFGVGNSSFRTDEIVGEVDTVPFGFFKKEIFNNIGLFDERLVRCQDYEFNRRIKANSGKIYMNSKIWSEYFNQKSLFEFYKKQLLKEAPYNPYMWYLAKYSFAIRHAITAVFTSGIIFGALLSLISPIIFNILIFTLILYFTLAILSSIQQAIRFKNITFILFLPFCFFLYHFIHGLGVISGIIKLTLNKAPVQKEFNPWQDAPYFYHKSKSFIKLPRFF